MPSNRLPYLDIIRGLSILMVLVNHHAINLYVAPMAFGHGVDVFFVISGFLIGLTCIKNDSSFMSFAIKRSFRIYPLYFAVLALIVSCDQPFGVRDAFFQHPWHYLFFLSNLISTPFLSLFSLWSLAIEEHFYLIVGAVLFIPKIDVKKKIVTLGLFLIASALAFRIYVAVFATSPWWLLNALYPQNPVLEPNIKSFIFGYNTLARIDQMGYGLLAAALAISTKFRRPLKARSIYFCLLSILFVGVISRHLPATINHSAVGLFVAAILWLSMQIEITTPMGAIAKFLARCGQYSYGIYLFHPTLLVLMKPYVNVPLALDFAIYLVVVFFLAMLSYELFEKRFIQWGKNLANSTSRS